MASLTNGKQESHSNNQVLRFDSLAILDWRSTWPLLLPACLFTTRSKSLKLPFLPIPNSSVPTFPLRTSESFSSSPSASMSTSVQSHFPGLPGIATASELERITLKTSPFADVTPVRPPDHEFNFARIGTETTESLAILLEEALRITRKTEALSSRINV